MKKIIIALLLLTTSQLALAVTSNLIFNAQQGSVRANELINGTLSAVAKIDFITFDGDEFWNRTSLDNTVEYNAIMENFFVQDNGAGAFSTTGQIVIIQSPVGTFSFSGNLSNDITSLTNSNSTMAEFNVDPNTGFGINISFGSLSGQGSLDLSNANIPDIDSVPNSFGNKEAILFFGFQGSGSGNYTHEGLLTLESVATISEVPLPAGWLLMVTALALLPKKKR